MLKNITWMNGKVSNEVASSLIGKLQHQSSIREAIGLQKSWDSVMDSLFSPDNEDNGKENIICTSNLVGGV